MPQLVGCLVLAIVVLIAYLVGRSKSEAMPSTLVHVKSNAPEMLQAIADARESLPYFWKKLASAADPSDFFVKVKFQGEKMNEAIWLSSPQVDGDEVYAIVNQSPAFLELRDGQSVMVEASFICDWMYSESGKIHGNYTGRIMGKPGNMSEAKYQEIRRSFAPLPTLDDLKS